jgi:hypothetical protein
LNECDLLSCPQGRAASEEEVSGDGEIIIEEDDRGVIMVILPVTIAVGR